MRLAVLSALAKLLRIRFKVDGLAYGATCSTRQRAAHSRLAGFE